MIRAAVQAYECGFERSHGSHTRCRLHQKSHPLGGVRTWYPTEAQRPVGSMIRAAVHTDEYGFEEARGSNTECRFHLKSHPLGGVRTIGCSVKTTGGLSYLLNMDMAEYYDVAILDQDDFAGGEMSGARGS